jgi:hypothetical protein
MRQEGRAPGPAGLQLARGVPLLRAEEQVFAASPDCSWTYRRPAR